MMYLPQGLHRFRPHLRGRLFILEEIPARLALVRVGAVIATNGPVAFIATNGPSHIIWNEVAPGHIVDGHLTQDPGPVPVHEEALCPCQEGCEGKVEGALELGRTEKHEEQPDGGLRDVAVERLRSCVPPRLLVEERQRRVLPVGLPHEEKDWPQQLVPLGAIILGLLLLAGFARCALQALRGHEDGPEVPLEVMEGMHVAIDEGVGQEHAKHRHKATKTGENDLAPLVLLVAILCQDSCSHCITQGAIVRPNGVCACEESEWDPRHWRICTASHLDEVAKTPDVPADSAKPKG
mmetsp:Transcript_131589/g.366717  ORF Transcript_131589/g.366717 Transcript_131589/m.366717 type:complete len:294 (+) Transcript_131589:1557-2438(+)